MLVMTLNVVRTLGLSVQHSAQPVLVRDLISILIFFPRLSLLIIQSLSLFQSGHLAIRYQLGFVVGAGEVGVACCRYGYC